MSLASRWQSQLEELQAQGRFRRLTQPQGLDFSSNDYLGYGKQPWPNLDSDLSHSGQASRLLRGHHRLWDQVEAKLAAWHGAEAVLMMNSGYSANEGLLSALLQPGDFIASDQFNHASIIDGIRLGKAERFVFRHNDLDHLESALRGRHTPCAVLGEPRSSRLDGTRSVPTTGGRFIVTEALFGMEGDRAPLRELADLAERYDAHLIVDEAHSTGCFGPHGSGLVDELGLRERVLATVHTGGKALGVCGAYICCSKLLRDVLINSCRHLIFTTALPPVIGGWWVAMLERVRGDDAGRHALHAAAAEFRNELAKRGIAAQGGDFIVPIILGDDQAAVDAANALQAAGFDIRAIRPPTVPPDTARLRVSIHADHTSAELRRAAEAIHGKKVK